MYSISDVKLHKFLHLTVKIYETILLNFRRVQTVGCGLLQY